jgi:hypothetical protein
MEFIIVALLGGAIGIAFTWLDYVWEPVRTAAEWCGIPMYFVLAIGAVGGAGAISLQYWIGATAWMLFA